MRHGVQYGIAINLTLLALILATGCGSEGTSSMGPEVSASSPAGVYSDLVPNAEELWSATVPRDQVAGSLESIHLLEDALYLRSSMNQIVALEGVGMPRWIFTRMDLPPDFPPVVGPTAVAYITRNKLWLIDRNTGDLLNMKTLSFIPSGPPALSQSTAYVPSLSDNRIYSISIADGSEGWRIRLESPISAAPVMGGSIGRPVLIIATEKSNATKNGNVIAYDAIDAGAQAPDKPLWEKALPDGVVADLTLSVDKSTVFVSSEDYALYAINIATGEKRWSYHAGRPLRTSAHEVMASTAEAGMVFQKNGDDLIAIESDSGDVKWSVKGALGPVCKWGDQYLVLGAGNTVQRISQTSGGEEASMAVGEDFIVCDHHGGRFILADRRWNLKVLGYKKY